MARLVPLRSRSGLVADDERVPSGAERAKFEEALRVTQHAIDEEGGNDPLASDLERMPLADRALRASASNLGLHSDEYSKASSDNTPSDQPASSLGSFAVHKTRLEPEQMLHDAAPTASSVEPQSPSHARRNSPAPPLPSRKQQRIEQYEPQRKGNGDVEMLEQHANVSELRAGSAQPPYTHAVHVGAAAYEPSRCLEQQSDAQPSNEMHDITDSVTGTVNNIFDSEAGRATKVKHMRDGHVQSMQQQPAPQTNPNGAAYEMDPHKCRRQQQQKETGQREFEGLQNNVEPDWIPANHRQGAIHSDQDRHPTPSSHQPVTAPHAAQEGDTSETEERNGIMLARPDMKDRDPIEEALEKSGIDADDLPEVDEEMYGVEAEEHQRELDKMNIPLCATCDDGGELVMCEGPCNRSFHTECIGLKDIPSRAWFCPHCRLRWQPCAHCGREGKAFGENQEVYKCAEHSCGCYYHKECTRNCIDGSGPGTIKEGKWWCPRHFCNRCGGFEAERQKLVLCLLCLRTEHIECVDRSALSQEDKAQRPRRLWLPEPIDDVGNVEVNEAVMYCASHEMHNCSSKKKREPLWLPKELTNQGKPGHRKIFSDWIMEESATVDSDIVTEHPGPFGSKMKQAQQQKFDLTLSEGESWWSTPEMDLISKVSSRIKMLHEKHAGHKRTREYEINVEAQLCESTAFRAQDVTKVHRLEEERLHLIKLQIENAKAAYAEGRYVDADAHLCPRLIRELSASRIQWRELSSQSAPPNSNNPLAPAILQRISRICLPLLRNGDCVVDFCCGNNHWLHTLRNRVKEKRSKDLRNISFRGFDVRVASADYSFEKRDFLQVRADELLEGNRLVIGLKPPVGTAGKVAERYLERARRLKPRTFVLVLPTEPKVELPKGYNLVSEKNLEQLSDGPVYRIPGSWDPTTGGEVYQHGSTSLKLAIAMREDISRKEETMLTDM